MRVVTRHNNHIITIQGISRENARQHRMSGGPFGKVTIQKYFELSEEHYLVWEALADHVR